MKSRNKELAFAVSSITELGISIIVSFLIWICLALWLKSQFGLGNFIMVIGVLLGAGSAGLSLYNFCKKISSLSAEKEEDYEDT